MVLLTVFTPTYNRAHTLPEAYCSLKAQTSKNFLWLIVDDGSTDRTAALVSAWMQAEKAFTIRYLYRPNGGMHAAHNTAYAHIETELNLCLDSDDRLAKDAVEQIEKRWAQIKSKNYAGSSGLMTTETASLLASAFRRASPKRRSAVTMQAAAKATKSSCTVPTSSENTRRTRSFQMKNTWRSPQNTG